MKSQETTEKNNQSETSNPVPSSPIMELENRYTSGLHSKRDVVIVRGEGVYLYDESGKQYVDMMSGFGVAIIGHANPYLIKAVEEQIRTLNVCHEIFYNDKRAQFLEKLASVMPAGLDRFFLCSSGAESVEGAIKFARLATGRKEIIATMKGFHGRTMGALSATWAEKYREPFKPLVPEFFHVPFNRTEELVERISPRTAAVIVEVVQGEGGINVGSTEYFTTLKKLCDDSGALLIFDEIQTAWGRTGKWFACQHPNVVPDMMCLAKGVAGGIPMGVVAMGRRLGDLPKGLHSSTFGGNPLACAAGIAAIQYMQDYNLIEHSRESGEYLLKELQKINSKMIREVRGLGLMIGIELKQKAQEYIRALMAEGVLAIPAGPTILRLLPPLVIQKEDINFAVQKIAEVLKNGR